MKNTKTILEKLDYAAATMRDYEQYNDDPEMNAEGEAADICDEAAALIKHLLSVLEEAKEWTLEDERTVTEEGSDPSFVDGNVFITKDCLNERFSTLREAILKASK